VHGAAGGAFADLETMDAVEPHAGRFGAVGVEIGQRRGDAARVPFLAVDRTGVAADADVEIDDEAEPLRPDMIGQAGHWRSRDLAVRKRAP